MLTDNRAKSANGAVKPTDQIAEEKRDAGNQRIGDVNHVYEELSAACEASFGFHILEASPIIRGWLNLKWKLTTDSGVFLLKQYHKERFARYQSGGLAAALTAQNRLADEGVPCPKLLTNGEEILQASPSGERFVVMEFAKGHALPPGQFSSEQMYHLGKSTGRMHRLINDGTVELADRTAKSAVPSRDERLQHWDEVYAKTEASGKDHLLPWIELHRQTTEEIAVESFQTAVQGFSHRDLWADNLLFTDDQVSAILDFDRLDYDFPGLDVAHVILSGALDGDDLRMECVTAFIAGYREEHSFSKGALELYLRMLWYLESTWWITPNMDSHSVPPSRFAMEMNWLAANRKALGELLGDL